MSEAATLDTSPAEDIQTETTATTETKEPTTVLDSQDDKAVTHPTNWPENWRQLAAGEDDKALKRLERYSSPSDVAKALIEAQNKIRQGLTPQKPGEKATDEEKAAWRQMLGVPEKVEDYFAELPEGLVIGEDDKELFSEFGAAQLEAGASKESVQQAVKWYYDHMEKVEQESYNANKEAKSEVEDFLLEEYGNGRKAQVANVVNLLNSLPDGAGELLQNASIDGVALLNHPAAMKALIHLSNEINPVGTVIPGGTNVQSIDSRLDEIRKLQQSDPKKYWSNEVQSEELKLIEAKEKLKARG